MGDCDCPASCQCSIRSSIGTAVTGDGATAPFTISLDIDGAGVGTSTSACNQARDCVAAHTGDGIAFDAGTGKFRVKISEDPGNTITIEPNGLYSAGGATACRKRVSDLSAATGGIVFGDQGAGTNHFPQGLRRSMRAAADLELDGVFLDVDGLADGTPYARFCGVVDPFTGKRFVDSWCVHTAYYAPNVASAQVEWREMTTQALRNVIVAADRWYEGDYHYWPTGPIPATAPRGTQIPGEQGQVTTGPYGGHNVGIMQIGGNTVAQIINDVGRDLVMVYHLTEETITQPTVAPALRDAIIRGCAQQSSIVVSRYIPDTVVASQAGIQTGYYARGAEDLAAPVTPASLKANGIDWLFVDWRTADAAITPYKAAGLRVILTGGIARRVKHQARVTAAGYNGVVSIDASYYLNRTQPFPLTNDLWPFGDFTSGQLHPLIEDDSLTAQYRGAPRNHQTAGLGYPPLCGTAPNPTTKPTQLKNYMGWNPDTTFEGQPRWGQNWNYVTTILGWACPLTNTATYSISWSHIWNSLPFVLEDPATQNGLGMLIGLATDDDVRAGAVPANFYWLHQTAAGRLAITRRAANVETTKLSTGTTANVPANVWQHFKVSVSPTGIVFEQYDVPSTKRNVGVPTLLRSVTLNAAEGEPGPRGPYVGIHKHQDGTGDLFSGGWGNFEYATP